MLTVLFVEVPTLNSAFQKVLHSLSFHDGQNCKHHDSNVAEIFISKVYLKNWLISDSFPPVVGGKLGYHFWVPLCALHSSQLPENANHSLLYFYGFIVHLVFDLAQRTYCEYIGRKSCNWTLNSTVVQKFNWLTLSTLRLIQNGSHFTDAILKFTFLHENYCILVQI